MPFNTRRDYFEQGLIGGTLSAAISPSTNPAANVSNIALQAKSQDTSLPYIWYALSNQEHILYGGNEYNIIQLGTHSLFRITVWVYGDKDNGSLNVISGLINQWESIIRPLFINQVPYNMLQNGQYAGADGTASVQRMVIEDIYTLPDMGAGYGVLGMKGKILWTS